MLKWAIENGCPWETEPLRKDSGMGQHEAANACSLAAEEGHFEVMKWAFQQHGCPRSEYIMARAARGGHIEIVKWLRENGCPVGTAVLSRATGTADLATLK